MSPRPHQPRPGYTGRGTLAARPPKDGRTGEGQRLTPDAPDNGGRPPPPGPTPTAPAARGPSQAMQAKGTVLGPHTRTAAPTARGRLVEGERLREDAPHSGESHLPPRTSSRHPHSAQHRLARAHAVGPMLGPHAHTHRARGTQGSRNPGCPPQRTGGRGRDSA